MENNDNFDTMSCNYLFQSHDTLQYSLLLIVQKYLVGVGSSSTGLGESSVLLLEDNPHPPSTEHAEEREDSHSAHCQSVPRCVDCSEEIRSVDE